MQKFNYHCHTTFSDGANTIEEMIAQAVKLGFTQIGISDHVQIHENATKLLGKEIISSQAWGKFAMDSFDGLKPSLANHINQIREISEKYPIKVLVGFEVDSFSYPGWLNKFGELCKGLDTDYLINGNHFFPNKTNDHLIRLFELQNHPDNKLVGEYVKSYFANSINSIESGLFTFAAHLDFIRWAKVVGEFDYRDERMAIIEALAKTGTPTEINTKGLESIGDFYPAQWMLKEMKVRKIPVVISDDAHRTSQIGRDFDKAEAMLEALDYKYRFSL